MRYVIFTIIYLCGVGIIVDKIKENSKKPVIIYTNDTKLQEKHYTICPTGKADFRTIESFEAKTDSLMNEAHIVRAIICK